nr:MAG TPA: hypothetical protein [Caudoviricetes sp.]
MKIWEGLIKIKKILEINLCSFAVAFREGVN